MSRPVDGVFHDPCEQAPARAQPRPVEAPSTPAEQLRADGNSYLAAGVGMGVFGVASAVLLGAVCPACVVVTPALLGAGAYKRAMAWRSHKRTTAE